MPKNFFERTARALHGNPAAMLSPPPTQENKDVWRVIAAMKELRRGNILGEGQSVRDLIEEGRRC